MALLKLARLRPSPKGRTQVVSQLPAVAGLDAFDSEDAPPGIEDAPAPVEVAPAIGARRATAARMRNIGGAAMLAALALGAAGYVYYVKSRPQPHATGTLTLETVPAGIKVFVGGKGVGQTPLTLTLDAGAHDLLLGEGSTARSVKVTVSEGASLLQHYELAPAAPAIAAGFGSIRVESDPPGLPVVLDGTERGVSPLTIGNLGPGDHQVRVRMADGVVNRVVQVEAGRSTSVIVAAAQHKAEAPGLTAGWVSIAAPIPLQVREGGRPIGSSDVEKLMLPSGDHTLEFVNDALGYRVERRVTVVAAKTTATALDVPNGTMSLNALPWADVFVDGERVGQTPIGNLSRQIGRHEVVFRHPDLGERKETVTVTTRETARLGVDLRKK